MSHVLGRAFRASPVELALGVPTAAAFLESKWLDDAGEDRTNSIWRLIVTGHWWHLTKLIQAMLVSTRDDAWSSFV